MTSADTAFHLFLSSRQADGAAPATLTEYRREVGLLLSSFPSKGLDDFEPFDIELFLAERPTLTPPGRGGRRCPGAHAPATRKKTIASLSAFFGWVHDRGGVARNPMRVITRPRLADPSPTWWTAEELTRLLSAPLPARDHLLLETLARTGQRSGPVRRLRWSDVHADAKPRIDFPTAKGGRRHSIPMHPALLHDMLVYRRLTNPTSDSYVFESRQGGPLSTQQVNRIIEKACLAAGVRVASAHEFRRSAITNLLQAGVELSIVSSDIAGHADPRTTIRHYRGKDPAAVEAALRGLPY